jgi:hypothetical protein
MMAMEILFTENPQVVGTTGLSEFFRDISSQQISDLKQVMQRRDARENPHARKNGAARGPLLEETYKGIFTE